MHKTVQNLISIQSLVNSKLLGLKAKERIPKIIAVSKTFKLDHILPLIEYGHLHFGENKVQEAIEKWTDIKNQKSKINLHLIGKLQTNKVKFAVKIFDYIHSLDSEKLEKKPKIFIQINIGDEDQKSGILKKDLVEFYNFSIKQDLDIIGLMCIPPFDKNSGKFFSEMSGLKDMVSLKELSMGMSSDYLKALEYNATFLRIGSSIFGQRD